MNKSDKRAPAAKGAHREGPAEAYKGPGLDQWSLAAVRARAARLGTAEVGAVEAPPNVAARRSVATESDDESPDRPGLSGDGSGLWWLPDALQDLANQLGLSQEGYRELVQEALDAASRTRSDRTRLILRSRTTQGEQHTRRSGLHAYVWPDELNAWLAAERRTYTWKPSLRGKDGPEAPAAEASDVSHTTLRRRPLMEQNKEAVLNALRKAGHEPLNLERRPSGTEWKPKTDARSTCGLTPAAFEHAWKALLKDRLLREQP